MMQTNYHQRKIRSFMRRQGRMTDGQELALDTHWEVYGLAPKGLLDLGAVFQREAPRVLEIGFGMGQSLFVQACQNPQVDYLGIEVHRPGIGQLLASAAANQLSNLRVICDDAVEILHNCLADQSLDGVQIFFPDPWQKRCHHKRRLIQPEFVQLLHRKLKPGAVLALATDWADYAQQMLKVLSSAEGFENLAGVGQFAPRPSERPLTKFELRGQLLGHEVWDLLFSRQ